MAVIVGDKLKLSNYSYLLERDGKGFVSNFQIPERRDRKEKIIDAVDIDWRPFRFKNFSYVSTSDKATYTYVTEAGDLFDTERLIDWISYAYSMGKNLDFNGYIFHNAQINIKRPTSISNIGWVDKDSRIIGYTYWPSVGSVSGLRSLDKDGCEYIFSSKVGEIFNDYENNIASADYSHAEGLQTHATGNGSHAEGFGTWAGGDYSHAEGGQAHAVGDYSHVGGRDSFANGKYSFAHGDVVRADGMYSVAFGNRTVAAGGNSFAEGGGFITIDDKTYYTCAAGHTSHAEGTATYAGGTNSHAEGNFSYATGDYSHAEGHQTSAGGESGHAEGLSTNASGYYSHTEGEGTIALSYSDHAEGKLTEAKGSYSHAEGLSSIAQGQSSHSEGWATKSTGNYSHSEGQQSEAIGVASHAEGIGSFAQGNYSHAEGDQNSTSGESSHVEGRTNTIENGNYSHSEGDSNYNSNSSTTHIEGQKNTTYSSSLMHVEGLENTIINSSITHVSGKLNDVRTDSSFIHGSENTINSGVNVTVFGKHNTTISSDNVIILGTESSLKSNSNFSTIIGHNSYTSSSYTVIIGNNTYISGTYSLLIGNELGSGSGNSILIGEKISNGFGGHYPISVGRNIVSGWEGTGGGPGYYNPLSIGVDIINLGKNNAVAIGYGINVNTYDNQQIAFGKYNVAPGSGYQFVLGDGLDNDNRHNAISITDNNWTYITALATYINNITTTEQNVAITYGTNFVTIKSFNEIKRGIEGKSGLANKDTNTYNLNFNTYILPTKRYVDKLLAAKDVFRYGGTFTPTDTAWTTNAKDNVVRGNWQPTVSPITDKDNDTDYSHSYSDKDFSAGAVWKVTSTGWFGTTYVMGGDLVISYDDTATGTNDKGWAVIDTQIAFMENYGTYSTYKGNGALLDDSNNDLRNFFVTNIHLSDTGYLTYSYAGILTEYRTDSFETNSRGLITKTGNDRNPKFLSNIALIRHDDRIELAYTYTDFLNSYTVPEVGQYTNIDTMTNENLEFVYNVHLSTDGVLSYSKYTMRGFRHHHHLTGAYNWSYAYLSYDTGDDLTYIVSNINLTYDGKLSYAYTVLSNLRDHHRTRTYDFVDFNNDTRSNELLKVLTNVNIDKYGTLTYTGYNVSNLLNHHHQSNDTNSYNVHTALTSSTDNKFSFVENFYMSIDGRVSYRISTVDNLRTHHDTVNMTYTVVNTNSAGAYTKTYNLSGAYSTSNHTYDYDNEFAFISNTYLDDKGTLTYTVSYVKNLREHHEAYNDSNENGTYKLMTSGNNTNSYTALDHDEFTVIRNVNLDKKGKLTYNYLTVGELRTHHRTVIPTLTTYRSVHPTNFTYNNEASYNTYPFVNEIKVIDNLFIDKYGTLTYTVSYINQLRHHHDNQSNSSLTCSYISTHKSDYINENEKLNRNDSYDGNVITTSNKEITSEVDRALFIDNVNLSADGKLTYTAKQISRLRNHHDNQSNSDAWTNRSTFTTHYVNNLTQTEKTHSEIDSTRTSLRSTNDIDDFTYIGNIHLSKEGKLSYTYTVINKIRSHHDNIAYKTIEYNVDVRKVNGDKALSDGTKIITEVNLSNDGILSYTSYNLTHLKHHHHTNGEIHTTSTTGRKDNKNEYDINVNGSKFNTSSDTDNSNRNIKFLTYTYLSSDGDLQTYYATISNIRMHHHTLGPIHNTSSDTGSRQNAPEYDFDANTSTSTTDSHRVLSYAWINPYGYLVSYYYTLSNLATHHITNPAVKGNDYYTYKNDSNYDNNVSGITNKITFLDGVYLSSYGKLTYHYSTIDNLRYHHSNDNKTTSTTTTYNINDATVAVDKATNKFGFISNVNLDKYGRFTYTTSSIDNLKSHHGTTQNSTASKSYNIYTSKSDGDNGFGFLTNVYLDTKGLLTYQFASATNLRKHHATDPGTSSGNYDVYTDKTSGNNEITFLTGVKLDTNGLLTYCYANVTDLRKHHSVTANTDKKYDVHGTTATNNIDYIESVTLTADGELKYTKANVTNLRNHHDDIVPAPNNGQQTGRKNDFLTDVSLTNAGTLNGTFGGFANNHNYSPNYSTDPRTSKATHDDNSGHSVNVLTYAFLDNTGQLNNKYETIEVANKTIHIDPQSNGVDMGNHLFRYSNDRNILQIVSQDETDVHLRVNVSHDLVWSNVDA